MNRLKLNLDAHQYHVTQFISIGDHLFLLLLDENKEVFSGNVICVNSKFELLHRFEKYEASGIMSINDSIVLYSSGYQFYFHPTTFEKQFHEWVK